LPCVEVVVVVVVEEEEEEEEEEVRPTGGATWRDSRAFLACPNPVPAAGRLDLKGGDGHNPGYTTQHRRRFCQPGFR